jgi:hypothetical protein
MTDDEITLPPLTDEQCIDLAREAGLDWHQGFPIGGEEENRYAVMCRAAVLLDRQQRDKPAPSAEPVACGACNGSGCMVRDPDIGTDQECFVCDGTGVSDDSTPPDHLAVMRQALEALEERYIGALRDNAIDALRAATGDTK